MTDEITIDPAPEKTISVLIVDDDDLFLRFCNRMLEREQFTVATAAHGQEALAMAADNVYDVILMDINMPHMSGLACLEKLKKGPSSAEVIIVTGRGDLQTAVEAMKLGASSDHYRAVLPPVAQHLPATEGDPIAQRDRIRNRPHRPRHGFCHGAALQPVFSNITGVSPRKYRQKNRRSTAAAG